MLHSFTAHSVTMKFQTLLQAIANTWSNILSAIKSLWKSKCGRRSGHGKSESAAASHTPTTTSDQSARSDYRNTETHEGARPFISTQLERTGNDHANADAAEARGQVSSPVAHPVMRKTLNPHASAFVLCKIEQSNHTSNSGGLDLSESRIAQGAPTTLAPCSLRKDPKLSEVAEEAHGRQKNAAIANLWSGSYQDSKEFVDPREPVFYNDDI